MKTLSLAQRKKLYLNAKEAYYNEDRPIMSDAEFDRLEDGLRKEVPQWGGLRQTGAAVPAKKTKTKLPFFMPSLGKAYPKDWPKWVRNHVAAKYLCMYKLDGSSVLLEYVDGKPKRLITRGDGEVGGDISFLLPFLNLPQNIKDKTHLVFRCEAIVKHKVWASKWATRFDNARQMANGLLNRTLAKASNSGLADLDIVVVGMYGCELLWALNYAAKLGFQAVPHAVSGAKTAEQMEALLLSSKKKSVYEIDGLVVVPANAVMKYTNSDRPSWAVAFKNNLDDAAPEAVVREMVWQLSQRGRITPKIRIDPIQLDGATVQYATAHNPAWLKEHNIGPGAVVKVLRSGGVIPKIVGVVKGAKFVPPSMPYREHGRFFVLDESLASTEHQDDVAVKALAKFLGQLGVEFLAIKTIKRLYDAGCKTPFHYMALASRKSTEPLIRNGLGKVQSHKIMSELLRAFDRVDLLKLMVGSNCFNEGVGERRLKKIQAYGLSLKKLLLLDRKKALRELVQIPSFQTTSAMAVVDGIPKFNKFLAQASRFIKVVETKVRVKSTNQGPLSGTRVSWTGYRSKEEESKVEALGGEVVPFSLTKTSVLLYKAGGKASTKVDKAKAKGLKVLTFSQFMK